MKSQQVSTMFEIYTIFMPVYKANVFRFFHRIHQCQGFCLHNYAHKENASTRRNRPRSGGFQAVLVREDSQQNALFLGAEY